MYGVLCSLIKIIIFFCLQDHAVIYVDMYVWMSRKVALNEMWNAKYEHIRKMSQTLEKKLKRERRIRIFGMSGKFFDTTHTYIKYVAHLNYIIFIHTIVLTSLVV